MQETSKRRRLRSMGGMLATGMLVVLAASPSAAEVVEGTCTGSVTVQGTDLTIADDSAADTTIEIPASGTVDYTASLGVEAPAEPQTAEGDLVITLPIGEWEVESWSNETTLVEVSGTETYRVPAWVPQGSGAIPLEVTHVQGDTVCRADYRIAVEGSPWSAQSALLVLLTVIAGIAMLWAGRDRGTGSGRPIAGAIAGFVFGLLCAGSLFAFGAAPLDSPLFYILPLVGMAIGIGLGAWGPFDSGQPSDATDATDETDETDRAAGTTPGDDTTQLDATRDGGQPPTEPR
ncbi:MAG TPA: hypothetical protein VJ978_06135 [Nitriliruptoraceae bacterium]|nr:hypothetical protein [Nitriliruptoraceae bacterium]